MATFGCSADDAFALNPPGEWSRSVRFGDVGSTVRQPHSWEEAPMTDPLAVGPNTPPCRHRRQGQRQVERWGHRGIHRGRAARHLHGAEHRGRDAPTLLLGIHVAAVVGGSPLRNSGCADLARTRHHSSPSPSVSPTRRTSGVAATTVLSARRQAMSIARTNRRGTLIAVGRSPPHRRGMSNVRHALRPDLLIALI